ncbi:MAG: hypothetical protein HY514_00675 [Candidatus Aenigmarchaeota archaeon]|nr:hypothetical protein [Candidatus Aenigmarchaeota archaeon]
MQKLEPFFVRELDVYRKASNAKARLVIEAMPHAEGGRDGVFYAFLRGETPMDSIEEYIRPTVAAAPFTELTRKNDEAIFLSRLYAALASMGYNRPENFQL